MKKMNRKTAATKMTMLTATMTATRSERALIRWAMCPASRLMGYACGVPGASEFAPVKIASFHRSISFNGAWWLCFAKSLLLRMLKSFFTVLFCVAFLAPTLQFLQRLAASTLNSPGFPSRTKVDFSFENDQSFLSYTVEGLRAVFRSSQW